MSSVAARIQSAEIDGRARAPRYIQRQLAKLHEALIGHAKQLQDAIVADTHVGIGEAELEVTLAVKTVRERYTSFDVQQALRDEYSVAEGKDWSSRRVPAGIVYIRPQTHTILFSIISPLESAIAAGNCVIVELRNSLQETPKLLQKALLQKLDHDTFGIVDSMPADSMFKERCIVVQQTGTEDEQLSSRSLHSSPNARVVAIVDRSADISAAARAIVRARASFRGRSPYAPDLVLVNEWAIKDFIDAAVVAFTKYLSGGDPVLENGSSDAPRAKPRRREKEQVLSKEEWSDPETTVVLDGDHGSLIRIGNRRSSVLHKKIASATLIVHPITSLDDAIDFANASGSLSASYHFGALPVTKYTTQFLDSRVSYVNHVPAELLVGPTAPLHHAASADARYRPEMFSVPQPQYLARSKLAQRLHAAVQSGSSVSPSSILKEELHTPLPPDGQGSGKVVGFFDQGLITGGTIVFTPVLSGIVVLGYYGIRFGLRRLK